MCARGCADSATVERDFRVHLVHPAMNDPEVSLPVNEDAERLVLACILLDDARLQDADRLCPDDFYFDRHRRVFRCMRELHVRGEAINPATVTEELRRTGDAASDNPPWLMGLC